MVELSRGNKQTDWQVPGDRAVNVGCPVLLGATSAVPAITHWQPVVRGIDNGAINGHGVLGARLYQCQIVGVCSGRILEYNHRVGPPKQTSSLG